MLIFSSNQAQSILRHLQQQQDHKASKKAIAALFPDADEWAKTLFDEGFISETDFEFIDGWRMDCKSYCLSPKGIAALEEIEDRFRKDAKDEKQRRFNNKLAVLDLFIAIISFVAGIFIEHFVSVTEVFSAILEWVRNLFF